MSARVNKTRTYFLVFIFILLSFVLLAGISLMTNGSATAQSESNSGEPVSPEGTVIFTCTISELAIHYNRIHIRCNPGDGGISFFAASSGGADALRTNQFLTLANTAYALGKTINIWYESNPADNPIGCDFDNCRKVTALVLRP